MYNEYHAERLSSERNVVIAVRYSDVLQTLYRPSERGVKNELIVHYVGATYQAGASTSCSPTVAFLVV